jgi:poly(3-hydroxybutyrate) depolymerase
MKGLSAATAPEPKAFEALEGAGHDDTVMPASGGRPALLRAQPALY